MGVPLRLSPRSVLRAASEEARRQETRIRMLLLCTCLLAGLALARGQGQQQQQQFIDSLRNQGFTDDQIRGFFASQQNRQRASQPPPQSNFGQPPQQNFQQQPGFQQQQGGFQQQQGGFRQQQGGFQQPQQGGFQQPPQGFPQQGLQQQQQQGIPPQGFQQQGQRLPGGFQQPQLPQQPIVRQQPQTPPPPPPQRSKVFFRVSVDGEDYGQINMELFDEVVPRTARNFYSIATGENQAGFTYTQSIFHRIIPEFMLQGGDFENFDGTGGQSIYGRKFNDENFLVKHGSPGLLSMAQTQMEPSSSSPLSRLTGWMGSMSSLEELTTKRVSILSKELSYSGVDQGNLRRG